ncbi:MAG: molybdate ABC transporter permease subunit [Steroidobacteraceae bacterium]|jgi:molybdate transport system permease protein|nr:molybdate ABC transporter permease subunit [Steroidobacteraceae bacterium]
MLSEAEWSALVASLVVGARAVAIGLPLAVATAWLLARTRFPGRTLLDALVHAPLVLPPVVVGYVLLLAFGVQGPVGRWLEASFGARLVFTSAGASLAAGVMAFPIMVRAVRLSLEGIDPGLELAARSLGAGPLDRFFSVTLPLALPGVIAAGIVGFAACLGEFGAVITFAASVPGETRTLPLAIYAALQTPGGEAAALRLALLSLGIALGALLLADWLGRRARRWSTRG